jgi:glycosyltransferase involved in cell wall biosynthesis
MKVVHVPFCFYPDPVGGTEIYVEALARSLKPLGVESVIAAPSSGDEGQPHQSHSLRVRRFAVAPESRDILREVYGAGDPLAAARFGRVLDEERPDVVHMHAFTRGASLRVLREAKRRRLPVVFTYHTPTVSCQRGTLLRYGREVCDGALDRRVCARCTLQGLGLNGTRGRMLSALPPAVGRVLGAARLEGNVWTALRMSELTRLRHEAFRELMREADGVVALCRWGTELLLRNGVPAEKIVLSRHGLAPPGTHPAPADGSLDFDRQPLRVAFLGRTDPTKGPDTLIRALRSRPRLKVQLDLYGIVQGAAGHGYFDELKQLAAGDARINFLPAAPADEVVALLGKYHLLAVPSRWLETGPLVVLEAFAAGRPVLGSRLGGLAELIRDGQDGLLVEAGNVPAWAEAFERLAGDRGLLKRLQSQVNPPRRMSEVAAEMRSLYRRLLRAGNITQPLAS